MRLKWQIAFLQTGVPAQGNEMSMATGFAFSSGFFGRGFAG